MFDTYVNGIATQPPPASAQFVARDTGNCTPRHGGRVSPRCLRWWRRVHPPPLSLRSMRLGPGAAAAATRYMRLTTHQIPVSADLRATSGMPLAVLVQPLALPDPDEPPIQARLPSPPRRRRRRRRRCAPPPLSRSRT